MPSGTCERCAAHRNWLHKHHLVLQCEGGTDADGILMICANCHEDVHGGPMGGDSVRHRRHNPEINARRAEAMKRRWADPEYAAKMRNRKPKPRQFSYEEMQRLRGSGLTELEVAERLGCSRAAVMRALAIVGDPGSRSASQARRRRRERQDP